MLAGGAGGVHHLRVLGVLLAAARLVTTAEMSENQLIRAAHAPMPHPFTKGPFQSPIDTALLMARDIHVQPRTLLGTMNAAKVLIRS